MPLKRGFHLTQRTQWSKKVRTNATNVADATAKIEAVVTLVTFRTLRALRWMETKLKLQIRVTNVPTQLTVPTLYTSTSTTTALLLLSFRRCSLFPVSATSGSVATTSRERCWRPGTRRGRADPLLWPLIGASLLALPWQPTGVRCSRQWRHRRRRRHGDVSWRHAVVVCSFLHPFYTRHRCLVILSTGNDEEY